MSDLNLEVTVQFMDGRSEHFEGVKFIVYPNDPPAHQYDYSMMVRGATPGRDIMLRFPTTAIRSIRSVPAKEGA